jgi:hypothetical protein
LWNLCEALGEFGSAPHASVESFLKAHSASSDSLICLQAVRARFKIFVKTEGLFRVNHQGRTRADFDSFVGALTAQFSTPGKMICSLIFAAALSDPRTGPVATPFRANYAVLQKAIQGSFQNLLANDRDNSTTDMLKKLIDRGDYLGVCVLVANGLKGGKEHRFLHTLIECCCNGLIASAGHDDASRHRALCFYLKKDYIRAFQVAQEVATRSPEWVDLQILVAEILTDTPDADLQAEQKVAYLRRTYPLTAEFEQRVVAIEAELASRRNREATRL